MLSHLLEIRARLLITLIVFGLFFVFYFIFSKELFYLLVQPLVATLPIEDSLIATHITSPVLTPISLAANIALLSTIPVFLFHIWRFIAPGLYCHERKTLGAIIVSSLVLFCLGAAFCFYLVLPFMFQFFVNAIPHGVKMMPDIGHALDFITKMLMLFGFCFQVPLICLTLVRLQWIDVSSLRKIRPYVIVIAFIVGMVLTPPDVLSQILVAVPLCLLYELGIVLSSRGFRLLSWKVQTSL